MPEMTLRVSGLVAAVHNVRIDEKKKLIRDPHMVTFVGVDPTKVAHDPAFHAHIPHLVIPIEYLADDTTCDDLITVREKEHVEHRQYAIWRITRRELRFEGLEPLKESNKLKA